MFQNWPEHTAHVKKSFGELGCESCISVHAAAAAKAGATESEIAGALATAISLNAGAAYTYALRALEAVDAQR